MTDKPRKLPVIYLIVDSPFDEIEQDAIAYFERSIAVALAGARCCVVAYEPAVPRCRTCKFYETRTPWGAICHEQEPGYEDSRQIPSDGSGFCHAHKPKEPTP
jgi:hypothetical protein